MDMPPLRRPDLWLPPLVLMAAIFYFSAQPSLEIGLGPLELVGRKLVHFGEYALLCLLWWRALRPQLGPSRAALVALLLSSGLRRDGRAAPDASSKAGMARPSTG